MHLRCSNTHYWLPENLPSGSCRNPFGVSRTEKVRSRALYCDEADERLPISYVGDAYGTNFPRASANASRNHDKNDRPHNLCAGSDYLQGIIADDCPKLLFSQFLTHLTF